MSAYSGEVCLLGGLRTRRGSAYGESASRRLGRAPLPPESEKWALRVLLEYFLVYEDATCLFLSYLYGYILRDMDHT